jgi:hypothetical protein
VLHFKVTRILLRCAVVLLVGHLAGLGAREIWGVSPDLGIVRQFDLNAEGNLAAWYSSLLLTCSAALAFVVATVKRLHHERMSGRWFALSAFFLVMAVDETAQLHDMATGPLRHGLGLDFGPLYFAWLIPALLIVAGAAIYFAPLVGSLSTHVRSQLVLACVVYLAGAVACEMIGGSVVEEGRKALSYLAVMTVEETLEILGGLLFVTALLHQVRELRPHLVVRWASETPSVELADQPVSPDAGPARA